VLSGHITPSLGGRTSTSTSVLDGADVTWGMNTGGGAAAYGEGTGNGLCVGGGKGGAIVGLTSVVS
jgi:hypothetical protein